MNKSLLNDGYHTSIVTFSIIVVGILHVMEYGNVNIQRAARKGGVPSITAHSTSIRTASSCSLLPRKLNANDSNTVQYNQPPSGCCCFRSLLLLSLICTRAVDRNDCPLRYLSGQVAM